MIVDTPPYARLKCLEGDSSFSLFLEDDTFVNGATIYFEHKALDERVAMPKQIGIAYHQDVV
ncbi:hypothetical protein [Pseudoalteromonas sp.]|uniref:hypothetical protein n=1 Tax=Pseudoalteromonas sp. TaxID=53249 RepID=UPI0035657131